jgi:hypothetical protein
MNPMRNVHKKISDKDKADLIVGSSCREASDL